VIQKERSLLWEYIVRKRSSYEHVSSLIGYRDRAFGSGVCRSSFSLEFVCGFGWTAKSIWERCIYTTNCWLAFRMLLWTYRNADEQASFPHGLQSAWWL